MNPGNWTNTSSFGLSTGTFIVTMSPVFAPGTTSTATFSNLTFAINSSFNNTGTNFYYFNDTRVRQTETFGTIDTYDDIFNICILTLTSAQATLYSSVKFNYTTGGSGINGTINGGSVKIYRIG